MTEEPVVCETPGVTVSGTTEAERKAAGAREPAAELEGALKVIRALGERIVEPPEPRGRCAGAGREHRSRSAQ